MGEYLTMESTEFNHRNTPSAFASGHFIFPPQAEVDTDNRISWLSLWNAQTMSRNRRRSRARARWEEVSGYEPAEAGVPGNFGETALAFRMKKDLMDIRYRRPFESSDLLSSSIYRA